MSLLTLPNELLILIAESFGPNDLKHLLEVNRRLKSLLTPQLHKLAHHPVSDLPSLHWGVLRNHLPLITLLLNSESTADIINGLCETGWTALHYAAGEGRTEMVRLLLEKGANTKLSDILGQTALEVAAQFGSKSRYHLITQYPAYRGSVKTRPITDWHIWPGDNEHKIIAQLLLGHGADKDAVDEWGRTSLFWAVKARNAGIVRVLLDAGADPNLATRDGGTPLINAAADPETENEIFSMLLDHGARTGTQDRAGQGALHHAASSGHVSAVALLLEQDRTFLDASDLRGRTALFHALMGPSHNDVGHQTAICMMLLEKGADYGGVDAEGDTVMHFAARAGFVEVCRALLERGARWDFRNWEGDTAFEDIMSGAWEGDPEEKQRRRETLVKMFLEKEKQDTEEVRLMEMSLGRLRIP